MSYDLIITTAAELHTVDACLYYEEQKPGLAERFLSELLDVYEKLAEHPQYYTFISKKDNYRDIKLVSFPYVVVYEIHDNEVIVVAVKSTHEKPLY